MFLVTCRIHFHGGPHDRFSADLEYVPDATIVVPSDLLELADPPDIDFCEQLQAGADRNSLQMCQALDNRGTLLGLLRSTANLPARMTKSTAEPQLTAIYRMQQCEIGPERGQTLIELEYHFVAFQRTQRPVRVTLYRKRVSIAALSFWQKVNRLLFKHQADDLPEPATAADRRRIQYQHESRASQS
jgi:hypothetical protein